MELFRKTRELEARINTFLSNINKSGELMIEAMNHYLQKGANGHFLELRAHVSTLEAENDRLRRLAENQLYEQMILPDMRSDIMKLLEGCDKLINKYESDLILISVEQPEIPATLKSGLSDLVKVCVESVTVLMDGTRAVIGGKNGSEFIRQVSVLEHQVDLQAIALKQAVFQKMKLPLARQLQLKEFIYSIEKISDMAEDTADMLSVFMVKHCA